MLERSELESDILPPTPQPWLKGLKNQDNGMSEVIQNLYCYNFCNIL